MTDVASDEAAGELERLRALVGPSETTYRSLQADRDVAQQLAKHALAESGQLRGRLIEMSVELSRARQDQDVLLLRAEMAPIRQVLDRGQKRWATSVAPRLSHLADRFRPS
jgi:hypothetical protein